MATFNPNHHSPDFHNNMESASGSTFTSDYSEDFESGSDSEPDEFVPRELLDRESELTGILPTRISSDHADLELRNFMWVKLSNIYMYMEIDVSNNGNS